VRLSSKLEYGVYAYGVSYIAESIVPGDAASATPAGVHDLRGVVPGEASRRAVDVRRDPVRRARTEPARRLSVSATDDVWRARGYGDFYSYCLVAEGVADIALAAQVSLRQLAALDVLVREAGGTFTDLRGSPGPHGNTAAATNGPLHNAVLGRFYGTAAVHQPM
jgi:fructose-1,6-bisphosphatase/inositol monophosphatase family enzyme